MKKAAEKATNYADNFVHTISHKNDIMEAFFDGYSEAREDMLKDAVEGEALVGYFSKPSIAIDQSSAQWRNIMKKFVNGDKVKVIVLKAEEE